MSRPRYQRSAHSRCPVENGGNQRRGRSKRRVSIDAPRGDFSVQGPVVRQHTKTKRSAPLGFSINECPSLAYERVQAANTRSEHPLYVDRILKGREARQSPSAGAGRVRVDHQSQGRQTDQTHYTAEPASPAPTRWSNSRRLPIMARLRHANCIERCPGSAANRKTYARTEFFSV